MQLLALSIRLCTGSSLPLPLPEVCGLVNRLASDCFTAVCTSEAGRRPTTALTATENTHSSHRETKDPKKPRGPRQGERMVKGILRPCWSSCHIAGSSDSCVVGFFSLGLRRVSCRSDFEDLVPSAAPGAFLQCPKTRTRLRSRLRGATRQISIYVNLR